MDTFFNPSVLEAELQAFLKANIEGGLCAVSEANLDEDKPAESTPYVTWNLISHGGTDESLFETGRAYNSDDKTVAITYENNPTITLSINCSHNTRLIAQTLAVLCKTWFSKLGSATLDENDVAFVDYTPTANRTVYIVNDYVYAFGFDVILRTKQTLTQTIEAVETVETTLNGTTEIIDLSSVE